MIPISEVQIGLAGFGLSGDVWRSTASASHRGTTDWTVIGSRWATCAADRTNRVGDGVHKVPT